MIYIFKFIPTTKKEYFTKIEFTLSAENKTQLYSRIQSQYGISKDKVEILKELNDDNISLEGDKKDEKKGKDIKGTSNNNSNKKTRNKR